MSLNVDPETVALRVAERTIPVPRHLSAEARAFLLSLQAIHSHDYPALNDAKGWRALIASRDATMLQYLMALERAPCQIRDLRHNGIGGYEIIPEGVTPSDQRVYLDFHGGGLIMGSGEVCKAMAISAAGHVGAKVVSVDYRMAPDHPYPAALDDCLDFYRLLLRDHRPEEIIIGGVSAGGNLVAATVLRARDEGLPLPVGCVLYSPELDLTESGDSFQTNAGIDPTGSLIEASQLYAAGHDLTHPYLSPLFGDFSKGFPPTIVTAGTRDQFLSNAVRMHRALRDAGIMAELHVLEAAPHGGFAGRSPEEASLDRDIRAFCRALWTDAGA